MTNYSSGHQAEKVAAEFLENLGYQIIELNWKTPVCEIDIVAKNNQVIYFIEVKYRKNNLQGSGFDYITPKKLNQMEFAAKSWVNINRYDGDYELSGIEVTGDYRVSDFIKQLS